MPVVPRKGPHPFAKPLVVFGVKRPRSSVIATEPCPTDTSVPDPESPNMSPEPTDTTQSPSWLDGPYGPAAEERQEAYAAHVRAGDNSLEKMRARHAKIAARGDKPKGDSHL
jgi:hypothetical protein